LSGNREMHVEIHSAPAMKATPGRVHFSAAPWPRSLKLISALGTILILAVGVAAYLAIPTPSGFTHFFGLGVALLLPGILVYSILFAVTGYAVQGGDLYVERLFFSTRIPLAGLSRVRFDPAVCRGSIRIWGNAGLYSFTGLYRSRALGRYRLFGTDLGRAVVLFRARQVIVITPTAPDSFIEHLKLLFPAVSVEPGERPS
jgi:hypothetical protein